MPGRNYQPASFYGHDYQGQYSEKDPETGLNSFDLRMYDARLGRWMAPDPNHEHASPYNAMANNPINAVDPTGGCDGCPPEVAVTEDPAMYVSLPAVDIVADGPGAISPINSSLFFAPNFEFQNNMAFAGQVNYNGYNVSSQALQDKLMQFSQYLGRAIDITGGDRTADRNKTVGGANASRHLFGDAADISASGLTNKELAIIANKSGLFNTVIYYPAVNAANALRPHVHLDLNPNHNNSFLIYTPTITNGSVTSNKYSPFTN